jgi:hypothetical protein
MPPENDPNPLETRLREIQEAAATEAELQNSVENEISRLLANFTAKMAGRQTTSFLSREAAAAGADPILARGWVVAGLSSAVHLPLRPAPRDLWPSGWADNARYEGLGVCTDGRVVSLRLDSADRPRQETYLQDAYAIAHAAEPGATCELLHRLGLGPDPAAVLERLTSALAATVHLHQGVEQLRSDGRTDEATSLLRRVERTRRWEEWASQVEAGLSCVEGAVERAVRLLECLESIERSVPRRWFDVFQKLAFPLDAAGACDLMQNPPWERSAVLEWFLQSVRAPPEELAFRRYVEGGWLRGSRWKETKVPGWRFSAGATEHQGDTGSMNWRPIVVTVSGEIRGWRGEELATGVGFNGRALQRMAALASLPPLPSPPDGRVVTYYDRYGHSSSQYADGAAFWSGIDFVHLGIVD